MQRVQEQKAYLPTMSDDKRKQPRFDTKQRLWQEGQQDARFGETLNISQGGMFIVGNETTEVGQEVQVSLQGSGDSEAISLKLEVMWKGKEQEDGPSGLGVRIVDFGEGKDVYSRFVEKLQSSQDSDAAETRPESSPPKE